MEENTNTTEKILTAIEVKKITPRPKWYFVLRNSVLWIPGIITTLLGAYTVAGVLYGILHAHWENRQYVEYTGPLLFIAVIPLLWIVSFGLFLLVTTSLLRKTHTGYRHTAVQLLLVSILSSVVIGILFYAFTAGSLTDGMETYYRHPTQEQQEYVWNNPGDGRISGVISANDGTALTVINTNGFVWTVDVSGLPASTNVSLLQKGNAIRIVGITTSGHSFMACRVLPWEVFPSEPSSFSSFVIPPQPSSCNEVLRHLSDK